jgi:hypothetical protein
MDIEDVAGDSLSIDMVNLHPTPRIAVIAPSGDSLNHGLVFVVP